MSEKEMKAIIIKLQKWAKEKWGETTRWIDVQDGTPIDTYEGERAEEIRQEIIKERQQQWRTLEPANGWQVMLRLLVISDDIRKYL